MFDSELVYNEGHMNGISEKYLDIANSTIEACTKLESAAGSVRTHYKGGANILFDETADVLAEHLKMLEVCANALSKYVADAYAEMKRKDDAHAKAFGGFGR